jgi:hypothetical protein
VENVTDDVRGAIGFDEYRRSGRASRRRSCRGKLLPITRLSTNLPGHHS